MTWNVLFGSHTPDLGWFGNEITALSVKYFSGGSVKHEALFPHEYLIVRAEPHGAVCHPYSVSYTHAELRMMLHHVCWVGV